MYFLKPDCNPNSTRPKIHVPARFLVLEMGLLFHFIIIFFVIFMVEITVYRFYRGDANGNGKYKITEPMLAVPNTGDSRYGAYGVDTRFGPWTFDLFADGVGIGKGQQRVTGGKRVKSSIRIERVESVFSQSGFGSCAAYRRFKYLLQQTRRGSGGYQQYPGTSQLFVFGK